MSATPVNGWTTATRFRWTRSIGQSLRRWKSDNLGGASPAPVCQHGSVNARRSARLLGVAVATAGSTLLYPPISASAAPCPDVEVTFARGTAEPPGVGGVGQAFIDSLRSQIRGHSLGVYAVNYPAGEDFAPSASAGAGDAHAHVQSMVANCPNARLILGGYSQGAMVIDPATFVAGHL